MSVTTERRSPPPLTIRGILSSTQAVYTLKAAVELRIFEALGADGDTARGVAERLEIDERGAALLLDALVGLDLIERQGERYGLTPVAELYLVPGGQLFLGDFFKIHAQIDSNWQNLASCIRQGEPVKTVNEEKEAAEFFPSLAAALFPLNYTTAQMLADKLDSKRLPPGARVLDLAAGSAVWSIPIAQSNSAITVDALDFPEVLAVAGDYAGRFKVSDQFRYLPGSWREVDLDEQAYDLVILGNILHSEGMAASEELLRKVNRSMKKGAQLVVVEFIVNEERTAPAFALMFALNMYLLTEAGCVFSLTDLDRLIRACGFGEIYRLELPYYGKESPCVVATRK